MKKILCCFFIFLTFSTEDFAQISPVLNNKIADTIIIFDPTTLNETTKVVVNSKEDLPNETYQTDTIITFNPETFEETIQIIKNRIVSTSNKAVKLLSSKIDTLELTDLDYQIDTIITFDPNTYEETIQIVRTKIKSKNN